MDKLFALRSLMKAHNIDAYIIPSGDDHSSEYVADYWLSRQWISGFAGSAGVVVVTQTEAGLWTDGRYFIQAASELTGSGISLYKMGEPGVPTYQEFLKKEIPSGGKVGFDGRSMSASNFDALKNVLGDITYSYEADLVGQLWLGRPLLPTAPAFEHLPKFAGLSAAEKLRLVRERMAANKTDTYLVTALDDIAWLLNIRGSDTGKTPQVYAFLLITQADALVFIDKAKLKDLESKLTSQGFTIQNYEAVAEALKALPATGNIYYNRAKTSVVLANIILQGIEILPNAEDIICNMKSTKSEVELANMRNAYIKEGVAMTKLLKWVDDSIADGKSLTEGDVADALIGFRSENEHCLGESFGAISAYGANAASPHYHHEGRGAAIKPEGFLLVDAGGQYLDGTTDTTRTIAVGKLTSEMKRNFTLVLKGHIALSAAVFVKGTTGHALDILARQPLLAECLDFNHGTGHGIGYCLSVHEGPQNVSKHPTPVALLPGMVLSNEPGFYKEGDYGIRTENVIAVKELCKNEYGEFLAFETLTYCPYDLRAIDTALLAQIEIEFINCYHKKVVETLSPFLNESEKAWLKEAAAEIKKC